MKVYSGRGLGDVYFQILKDLTKEGRGVEIEGKGTCLEFTEPVCIEYTHPGYCWMRIPGRKWNPFLALAEVVWILSGSGSVDWISYFGSNLKNFQDGDNPNFHGAYGLRMRHWSGLRCEMDQITAIIDKLRTDPTSRQAIISLWDPYRDNVIKSKDIPCNNWVGYTLRDGVLDQTVVIRSNDLIWGTPYNAIQFSHLHAYVAGHIGPEIKMGKLTYVINNLHYYMDLYKPTLSHLLEKAYEDTPLKAECVPNYDTITRPDFDICKIQVEEILERFKDPEMSPKVRSFRNSGHGYFGHTVPCMIWLYTFIKSGNFRNAEEIEYVADKVAALPEPLRSLVVDFYQDSKSLNAREVLHALKSSRREHDAINT